MNLQAKAVLLGDSGVGKSSIALLLLHQTFFQDVRSSIGSSYFQKQLELPEFGRFKLKIWDTAGQERFRAFSKIYYKDAEAAIIVYDISKRKSFESVKSWISQVREISKMQIALLILANKSDLVQQEQVGYDQGAQLAIKQGALFKMVSAKMKQGIQQAFQELCCRLAKQKQQDDGKQRISFLDLKQSRRKRCC